MNFLLPRDCHACPLSSSCLSRFDLLSANFSSITAKEQKIQTFTGFDVQNNIFVSAFAEFGL